MKSLLTGVALALPLVAFCPAAHAQFFPPADPTQSVSATAGSVSDSRQATGTPGTLSAFAADIGSTTSGQPYVSSASADTAIGPGYLTGSVNTAVTGATSSSASLSAYQKDTLTMHYDAEAYGQVLLTYSIVIAGSTALAIDPLAAGGTSTAGTLYYTFVHRISEMWTSAWSRTTTLAYDGTTTTTSDLSGSGTDPLWGVYTRTIRAGSDYAFDMEFYLEMSATLNALALDTSGSITTDAPTIYWNGITSVQSMKTGEQVLDYTVTSASGFNYALSAVPSTAPEPAAWLMAAIGLGALGVWRRRPRVATHALSASAIC